MEFIIDQKKLTLYVVNLTKHTKTGWFEISVFKKGQMDSVYEERTIDFKHALELYFDKCDEYEQKAV